VTAPLLIFGTAFIVHRMVAVVRAVRANRRARARVRFALYRRRLALGALAARVAEFQFRLDHLGDQ
jgi:hypothetical protein